MEQIENILQMFVAFLLRLLELFVAFAIGALQLILEFARSIAGTVL